MVSIALHLHCSSLNDLPVSQNRLLIPPLLKMVVLSISETMITIYQTTCFHKPEDQNINVHDRKKLRTHLIHLHSNTSKPNQQVIGNSKILSFCEKRRWRKLIVLFYSPSPSNYIFSPPYVHQLTAIYVYSFRCAFRFEMPYERVTNTTYLLCACDICLPRKRNRAWNSTPAISYRNDPWNIYVGVNHQKYIMLVRLAYLLSKNRLKRIPVTFPTHVPCHSLYFIRVYVNLMQKASLLLQS
jgi:hypothetical protein